MIEVTREIADRKCASCGKTFAKGYQDTDTFYAVTIRRPGMGSDGLVRFCLCQECFDHLLMTGVAAENRFSKGRRKT